MSGTLQIKIRSVGAQTPLNYTTGFNQFSNQAYAVANVAHRDYFDLQPLRTVTSFGNTVEYDMPRDHDYWPNCTTMILACNQATTNTAFTDERWVEGAGYRIVENVKLSLTSTRLNSVTIPFEWQKIRDMIFEDDRLQNLKGQNYLVNQSAGYRQQQLQNAAQTFKIDIETGYDHSRECLTMVSTLSNPIRVAVQLAKAEEVIQVTGGTPAISNLTTLINSITFRHWAIHITMQERNAELSRYDSKDGLFTLIDRFEVYDVTIPAATNNMAIQLSSLTNTYEGMILIFRGIDQITQNFNQDPLFWTGPSFTYTGTSGTITNNMPDEFDFKIGSALMFPRMDVQYNVTEYRRHFFPYSTGGDYTPILLFTEDPIVHNAVLGTLDFNTGARTLDLYWNGSNNSGNGTMHLRIIVWGPDYLHKQTGTANVVFG